MRKDDLPWNNRAEEEEFFDPVYLHKKSKSIWAIAGGKGGTGKSFLSLNMAISMAFSGMKTVLIDLDILSPSLNIFFNKDNKKSLDDYYRDKSLQLEDILVPSIFSNLSLIKGAMSVNSIPKSNRELLRLNADLDYLDADIIILDIGAGSHNLSTDYFNFADKNILVLNPNPQSVLSSYFFLRQSLYSKICFLIRNATSEKGFVKKLETYFNDESISPLELVEITSEYSKTVGSMLLDYLFKYKPKIILNKVESKSDSIFYNKLHDTVSSYLNLNIELISEIKYDSKVEQSLKDEVPFILKYTEKDLSQKILETALSLDDKSTDLNPKYLKQILKENKPLIRMNNNNLLH
jgi:flagellar biosynthesis protein FlhG